MFPFSRTYKLNISKPTVGNTITSEPIKIPIRVNMAIQFYYTLGSAHSTIITLQTSHNNIDFNTAYSNTNPIDIRVHPSTTSETLQVKDILSQFIRFHIEFPSDEAGSVDSCIIIST